jgi:hypothetical protein
MILEEIDAEELTTLEELATLEELLEELLDSSLGVALRGVLGEPLLELIEGKALGTDILEEREVRIIRVLLSVTTGIELGECCSG